ncbi:MAG: hypothetical protein H7Z41_13595 [Cytophagales bacterium]|nr:hypothetical protein [Armatimonadota bacterium]
MWVYVRAGKTAFNLDHVSRMFVEETGSGAALKAEVAGKMQMIAYFDSKAEAQSAIEAILETRESGAAVFRL